MTINDIANILTQKTPQTSIAPQKQQPIQEPNNKFSQTLYVALNPQTQTASVQQLQTTCAKCGKPIPSSGSTLCPACQKNLATENKKANLKQISLEAPVESEQALAAVNKLIAQLNTLKTS